MSEIKIYLPWNSDEAGVWSLNNFIWSEVYIVEKIAGAFSDGLTLKRKITWDHLEKELDKKDFTKKEKQTFLKVIAKVNGLTTTNVKKIDASIKRQITVDHVRNTFRSFGHKIDVKVNKVKKE